jgi:ABC-type multidrug transport system ATPase subunit
VPADLAGQPGLHIRGLTKQFPGAPHPAVSDFNLSCFDGQIFVLLGHNGAGKSTTLNMLTGTVAPTSGTAEVFGHSITDPEGLERIRQITGYCPQKDILYSLLTVQQHLYFFAALKGLSSDDQSALVEKYLKEIQLVDARHTLASDLSGGMKRRLCLAIGFITGSKVVYVDEVTSGIDPASRRAIWNILMRKRDDPKEGKRVIILTTHFMDEADYLGDRIGIMHGGKLVCCGSSMFLKSKFGVGYDLTINVASAGIESVCNNVGSLLRTHVPSAELRGTISAAEAIFRLPLTAAPQFPAMLQDLENNKRRLGMESFGLSVTTLEDVFLRVADINAHQSKPANESAHKGFDDAMLNFSDFAPSWRRQMYSMFIKRLHLSRRDPKMWMLSLVLPCLIIALGLGLLKLPINIAQNVNLLSISAQYGDNTAVPIFAGSLQSPMSSGHKIASLNGPHAFPLYSTDLKFNATQWDGTMVRNFSSALLSTAGQNASRYGALLFADPKNYVIYINKSAVHAVPTFLNYAHQALLRYYTNNPTIELNTELTVFPPTLSERAQIQTVLGIVTTVIILLSFAFIPGSAPALLIKEVEIKFKHMQVSQQTLSR